MSAPTAANLLDTIVAATRRIVEVRQRREPLSVLAARAEQATGGGGRFLASVSRTDRINIIAECKRRSPLKGVLRTHYDAAGIAQGYERAGAAAISVLTEPAFFDGALDHLQTVRQSVRIPLLRKDFIVSEYQLLEAKAAGGDAVLLIVAVLEESALARLHARAVALDLDVLVEVHGIEELSVALDAGARLVGVNNRNLRTFEVDTRASEDAIAHMPNGVIAVSESGLKTAGDLIRLRNVGYHGFLIGERFMAADDPGRALAGLLDACGTVKDTKDRKGVDMKGAGA